MGSIAVRPDIYEKHRSLFGEKTVNGRRVNVEELIAQLTRDTKRRVPRAAERAARASGPGRPPRAQLHLPAARHEDQRRRRQHHDRARHPPGDARRILRTQDAAGVAAESQRADSEGHDAAGSRRHRSGDRSRHGDGRAQHRRGVVDVGLGRRRRRLQGPAVSGVGEPARSARASSGSGSPSCTRRRSRAASRASTRSICRPKSGRRSSTACRDCTCRTGRSRSTASRCRRSFRRCVMHAVSNYDTQKKNGSGVYYYVPKIETWQEARLVSSLLKRVEEALGLPRGTLKIKMLNERAEYALQQEAIMWVLRENLIGPNVGRWDYLNSREEMFRHDPAMVIPDPNTVTMTEPSLIVLHDAQRAARAARRRHADRRHGGADAESAGARERSEGAARHLVRQAARAADGTLQDRRQGSRHVPAELGGDHHAVLRRGRPRSARHRRRRSAGRRRQADARREEAARRSRTAERRQDRAARAVGGGSDAGEAVLGGRAQKRCCRGRRGRRPKTGCATRCTCRRSSCTSSFSATTRRRSSIRGPACGS